MTVFRYIENRNGIYSLFLQKKKKKKKKKKKTEGDENGEKKREFLRIRNEPD